MRRTPGEDLVEHRAQQVDVGALAQGTAATQHLRRPVVRRPREAGLIGGERQATLRIGTQAHRQTPVDEVDLSEAADHDVLGLQIAMDHAA